MTVTVDQPGLVGPASLGYDLDPVGAGSEHQRKGHRRLVRRILSEGGLVFLAFFGLYLAVGAVLDFHYLTFQDDAYSRAANGFYVFSSRDPHLAAIGFVWNPGMSIADIVPLLFNQFWRPLATHLYAASIVSSACMAGAVYQVRCILLDWGVARALRLVLVVVLALNGMVLYYGGNGMSEGLYLFTLVASSCYLLRWMRDDDLASLVYSASALGICYLVRNEAVGAAFLGGLLVLGVGFARATATKGPAGVGGIDRLGHL